MATSHSFLKTREESPETSKCQNANLQKCSDNCQAWPVICPAAKSGQNRTPAWVLQNSTFGIGTSDSYTCTNLHPARFLSSEVYWSIAPQDRQLPWAHFFKTKSGDNAKKMRLILILLIPFIFETCWKSSPFSGACAAHCTHLALQSQLLWEARTAQSPSSSSSCCSCCCSWHEVLRVESRTSKPPPTLCMPGSNRTCSSA